MLTEGIVQNDSTDSSENAHHINIYQSEEEIASQDSVKQTLNINNDNNELLSESEGNTNLQISVHNNEFKRDGMKIKTTKKPKDKTYNTVISIHNEASFQSYVFSGTISKLIICEFMAKWCPRSRSFISVFNTLSREYGKYAMFFRICEEEQDGKSKWYNKNKYKKLDSVYELQFYQNGKLLGCHEAINKKTIRYIVRKYLGIESQQRHKSQPKNKPKQGNELPPVPQNIVNNQQEQSNYFINNEQKTRETMKRIRKREKEPYPDQHLTFLSCLVCILCACGGGWICALCACRFFSNAETAYRRGYYGEYRRERSNAWICIIIACIVGILGWVVFIITKGFK